MGRTLFMKILVTGSAGFIGARTVEKLKERGHEIIPYDVVTGQNLMNFQQLSKAIQECDEVLHIAAAADLNWIKEHPYDGVILNIAATHNVAHLCAKYKKRMIYASTVCVYGNQKEHPETEETLPNPSELYACSKYAAEWVVRGYGYNYGMPWTILRFATIYGEGMREALGAHIFFTQAMKGEPITVHGDGKQERTLTYIDDLVDGIVKATENKEGSKNDVFNLTAEEPISANKMAEDIKEITGSKSEIVNIPQRANQTIKEEISAKKALSKFGWKANTSWDDGLKKTYDWMKTCAL